MHTMFAYVTRRLPGFSLQRLALIPPLCGLPTPHARNGLVVTAVAVMLSLAPGSGEITFLVFAPVTFTR